MGHLEESIGGAEALPSQIAELVADMSSDKIFGQGAIAVSFHYEEYEEGLKVTEIFRNVDAAEEYYNHFMKDKVFVCYALTNLPFRQKPGPTAVVDDGNVKAWVTNPARVAAEGPQTIKYNHLKIGDNKGKVEVVPWETPPTPEKLAEQFGHNGKFHFGWVTNPSMAQTDLDGNQVKPMQQEMN